MNDPIIRKTPLPPTRATGNHIYTKLQVRYGGDVQDLVLKTENEPTSQDLRKTLEEVYRIPMKDQLIYFRGQRLHHYDPAANNYPLSRYGIFSGNSLTIVGKQGLL